MKFEDEGRLIIHKAYGIRLYLGDIAEADLYKPYIQKLFNLGDITKELYDDSMEAVNYVDFSSKLTPKLPIQTKVYREYIEDDNLTKKQNKNKATKKLEHLRLNGRKKAEELNLQKEVVKAYKNKRSELLTKKEQKKIEDEENEIIEI